MVDAVVASVEGDSLRFALEQCAEEFRALQKKATGETLQKAKANESRFRGYAALIEGGAVYELQLRRVK